MNLQEYVNGVRVLIHDTGSAKVVRLEDLSTQVVTGTRRIALGNFPVIESSLTLYHNGEVLSSGYYTVASDVGEVLFSDSVAGQIQASYKWQWFADSDVEAFIKDGIRWLQHYDDADPATVPDGLTGAVEHFAAHHCYAELYARTSHFFSGGAGGKNVSKDSIPTRYMQMSKDEYETAKHIRDSFYEGAGKEKKAAVAIGGFPPGTPYQSRR